MHGQKNVKIHYTMLVYKARRHVGVRQ